MKKTASTFLLLVLATLVFYGGAGVNIVSYCCSDCRTAGLTEIAESGCCEIHSEHGHGHSHSQDASQPVGVDELGHCAADHSDLCGVERVKFDWNSIASLLPDLQQTVIDLGQIQLPFSLLPDLQYCELLPTTITGPPIGCPRAYLSLLTVLLI